MRMAHRIACSSLMRMEIFEKRRHARLVYIYMGIYIYIYSDQK